VGLVQREPLAICLTSVAALMHSLQPGPEQPTLWRGHTCSTTSPINPDDRPMMMRRLHRLLSRDREATTARVIRSRQELQASSSTAPDPYYCPSPTSEPSWAAPTTSSKRGHYRPSIQSGTITWTNVLNRRAIISAPVTCQRDSSGPPARLPRCERAPFLARPLTYAPVASPRNGPILWTVRRSGFRRVPPGEGLVHVSPLPEHDRSAAGCSFSRARCSGGDDFRRRNFLRADTLTATSQPRQCISVRTHVVVVSVGGGDALRGNGVRHRLRTLPPRASDNAGINVRGSSTTHCSSPPTDRSSVARDGRAFH